MNQRRFGRERPWKFGRFSSGTGTFNDLHVVLQREKFFIIRYFLDAPRASRPTSYSIRKIIDFKQNHLLLFITISTFDYFGKVHPISTDFFHSDNHQCELDH